MTMLLIVGFIRKGDYSACSTLTPLLSSGLCSFLRAVGGAQESTFGRLFFVL